MKTIFLKAEWRNLIMANFLIEPEILKKYIPCRAELDSFNGQYYVSLVGFLFTNTSVKGVSFPFHTTFEEVNLRFYVRYKEEGIWKRGVVFMKEIVPKRIITFIANTIYKENYETHKMEHIWDISGSELEITYKWKMKNTWNYIKASAAKENSEIIEGSEEEFITEHYWGYTHINDSCMGEYQVIHPKWKVHKVNKYDINCSTGELYGKEFIETLENAPVSVFLAEGSPIEVYKKKKIYALD
jgi:uncharacterized protein YqjF (DUF2071 family)